MDSERWRRPLVNEQYICYIGSIFVIQNYICKLIRLNYGDLLILQCIFVMIFYQLHILATKCNLHYWLPINQGCSRYDKCFHIRLLFQHLMNQLEGIAEQPLSSSSQLSSSYGNCFLYFSSYSLNQCLLNSLCDASNLQQYHISSIFYFQSTPLKLKSCYGFYFNSFYEQPINPASLIQS